MPLRLWERGLSVEESRFSENLGFVQPETRNILQDFLNFSDTDK